jgi:hypothetical protein
MSSRFSNKYPIPEKFPEILHDFSREVLRYMPKDILDFSVQYFYSLEIGSPLNYIEGGSKNIPKSLDLEKKDLKRQDISTPSVTTNQNTQNLFFKQGEQSEKRKEKERDEIKELKETNSSKMNTPQLSEASRPQSQQSHGSGVVSTSKRFVNDVLESSQLKVKESLKIYAKKDQEKNDNENIYNRSGHTFSDISGNSEDKNLVRSFVGEMFTNYKKNNSEE